MNLFRRKLQHFLSYIPVRRNGLVLILLLIVAFFTFNSFETLESDRATVQIMLSLITIAICLALLAFSLLTTLPPFLLTLFRKRYTQTPDGTWIDVEMQQTDNGQNLILDVQAPGAAKPWLGYLHGRLTFDDYTTTPGFLLHKSLRSRTKKSGRYATSTIELPNIRDYRIHSVSLYFQDVFNLLSLPLIRKLESGVYTRPDRQEGRNITVESRKSDEPVRQVVTDKKAQGDFLDYKKYAPGDDIRRIIWSNYARTGELTIRIPDETMPFVSKVRLLASFYDGSPGDGDLDFKKFLLDIYKEKLRQVIDALREQDFEVSMILDQEIPEHYVISDPYEKMIYQLSAAQWQSTRDPGYFAVDNSYRLSGATTVIAFSTLCPSTAVENLRSLFRMDLNLCHYDVRRSLEQIKSPSMVKRLFLINAFEPFDLARRKQEARGAVRYLGVNGSALQQQLKNSKFPVIEV